MTVMVQEREVARGPVGVVLAMCLGLEALGRWARKRASTSPERASQIAPQIDPGAGTVHWDSMVAVLPDWQDNDDEADWLGI